MNSQLATALAAISAQLDNLTQITESSNQTLDRIITKVEKEIITISDINLPDIPTSNQDVQTSLQKEEPEDNPQEKENEMQTDESSNTSEINKNVSFKGEETIENDSEKKKHNDAETEISPNVVLEDPETATGSEDNLESETEKQITEDNSEEYSLIDKEQVNKLSLENKQQCRVPINTHVYEDKFWNYIVTKDVGQIRDIFIYGRFAVKDLRDAVMGESHTLQIINFFSLTVKQKGIFTRTLPVKISLVIINKVIGNYHIHLCWYA